MTLSLVRSRLLINQLTSGICAWLTLQQMKGNSSNLSESSFYEPLHDIARGQDYKVIIQFPLPRRVGQLGASESYDLVMLSTNKRHILVLEVKYKKPGCMMTGTVTADAVKMIKLTDDQLIIAACKAMHVKTRSDYVVRRAAMVIWRRADIVDQFRLRENALLRKQWFHLIKGMITDTALPVGRTLANIFLDRTPVSPVGNRYGSLRAGATITPNRFWVATLNQRALWHNL